ncbi:hypothetical protein EST38_g14605 [Candolleomyces aberdarensis]|uniref:Uncharacterized protein n=1 Tax=Candolleomyces aberdarensis TaxID=2316362 RepID=A0A4Q2CWU9_9AGAR|nr:hypothetical protein EST38_g14605 [Candolleomyces aberdarensis]
MAPTLTIRSNIQLPPSISRALLCLIRQRKRSKSSLKGVKHLPIRARTQKSRTASSSRASTATVSPAPATPKAFPPPASLHVTLGGDTSTPRLRHFPLGYDQHFRDKPCPLTQDTLYSVLEEDRHFYTQDVRYLCNQQDTQDRPSFIPTHYGHESNPHIQEEYGTQGEPYLQGQAGQHPIHESHRYSSTQDVQYLHNQQDAQGRPCFSSHDHYAPLTNHLETSSFCSDEDYPMHDLSEELSLVEPVVDAERVQPCDHLVILHEVMQTMHFLNEALDDALGRYDSRFVV